MKTDNITNQSGGIGFCSLLAILFITLKLLNVTIVATWSWWWVLSPLWIPAVLIIALLGFAGFCLYMASKS